eukprot:jgi/Picsp_1/1592/NSC_05070-R1_---NA---
MTAATPSRPFICVVPGKEQLELAYGLSSLTNATVWPARAVELEEHDIVWNGAERNGAADGNAIGRNVMDNLLEWSNKGCHSTVAPLDGRKCEVVAWVRRSIEALVDRLRERPPSRSGSSGRSSAASGRVLQRKIGISWCRPGGWGTLETVRWAQAGRDAGQEQTGWPEGRSRAMRPDSFPNGTGVDGQAMGILPTDIVNIECLEDVERVMFCLLSGVGTKRERVRMDMVLSVVLYDELECIVSTVNFVLSKTRIMMLPLIDLLEEVILLHAKKRAGDHVLKNAQMTEFNCLAAQYLAGNVKLFVVQQEQNEGNGLKRFMNVSSMVSVCVKSQTLRTDVQWHETDVFGLLTLGDETSSFTTGDSRSTGNNAQSSSSQPSMRRPESEFSGDASVKVVLQSPRIEAKREEMKSLLSRSLSDAAMMAVDSVSGKSSPTNSILSQQQPSVNSKEIDESRPNSLRSMQPEASLLTRSHRPEQRALQFASLESANGTPKLGAAGDIFDGYFRGSRDVFSSLPSFSNINGHQNQPKFSEKEQNHSEDLRESEELDEPSLSLRGDNVSIPEFVEARSNPVEEETEVGFTDQDLEVNNNSSELTSRILQDHICELEVERRVNKNLLREMDELEHNFKSSQQRVMELELLLAAKTEEPEISVLDRDFEGTLEALRRERKNTRELKDELNTMKSKILCLEVEMSTKDREIALMSARLKALQNKTDISKAFKLCEDALLSSQQECKELKLVNQDLSKKLSHLEVSNMLGSYLPILPDDGDGFESDLESKIICDLQKRLKMAEAKLERSEKSRRAAEEVVASQQRDVRASLVQKRVAENALRKVEELQYQLACSEQTSHAQSLLAAEALARTQNPYNFGQADHYVPV